QDRAGLAGTLNFALRLGVYVSVPATIGLVALRTPIVRLLFERGRFGPAETAATADALAWYAVGLAGFAGSRIAAQAFYAMGEARTAARGARARRRVAGRDDHRRRRALLARQRAAGHVRAHGARANDPTARARRPRGRLNGPRLLDS